ncbi:unnamed protein product [Polarella glacialis]|uniref:EF-hand domain-containing protein n=1 Tax=Polarella glacialis TaxID=89957 RepID=A0A813G4J2_POLGL|nr:unnamed protein product [Polarella glacialis]
MRQYRRRFIAALPALVELDRRPIASLERASSEAWVTGGHSAEVSVKMSFPEQDRPETSSTAKREVSAWALPGSECSICGCRHPPEKPRLRQKQTSAQDAADVIGGKLGQGEKISKWDLKEAGFERAEDDLTVGWRKMPDFLMNMSVAPKKPPLKIATVPEAGELAAAKEACATVSLKGRQLSLELLDKRGVATALSRRQRELQLAAASLSEEETGVEQHLRESKAVEQLRGLSKAELGEVKAAGRSMAAPAAMRALLEAVYHVLTVQPGRPFKRIDQREWLKVQRIIQADDLVDRVLDFSPERLLDSAQLMRHLASLTDFPAASSAVPVASAATQPARGSLKRVHALGSGGTLNGPGYTAFHSWIAEVSTACRRLRDLRRRRSDLQLEIDEASLEAEELAGPCRELAHQLLQAQSELQAAQVRLEELEHNPSREMAATLRFLARAASKHNVSSGETPTKLIGNRLGAKTPKTPVGSPVAHLLPPAAETASPKSSPLAQSPCEAQPMLLGRASGRSSKAESSSSNLQVAADEQVQAAPDLSSLALAQGARGDDLSDLRAALRAELRLAAAETQETLRGILRAELQGLLQELLQDKGGQSFHGEKTEGAGVVAELNLAPAVSAETGLPPPLILTRAVSAEPGLTLPRRNTELHLARQNSPELHMTRQHSLGSRSLDDSEVVRPEPWRRHPRKAQGQSQVMSPKRKPGMAVATDPRQVPLLEEEKLLRPSRQYGNSSVRLPRLGVLSLEGETWVTELVESALFSYFIAAMILFNAVIIGQQTDYMARYQTTRAPAGFEVFETVFCFIFTTEISLRIYVHRASFFLGPERRWNLFDVILVAMQFLEQLMGFLVSRDAGFSHSQLSEYTDATGTLRVLRIFRLLRILRLLRIVHLSGELQAIIVAITMGMRSFCWTVALMLLLTYLVGVFFTQCVTDHKVTQMPKELNNSLEEYYGTLDATMLALFQAISGGKEWRDMLSPVMDEISVWLAVPFCMYIAFVLFSMMNILTGIFVDKSMQSGQEEKRKMLLQEIQAVFDDGHSSEISWPDFQAQLQNPHLQELFAALDVDEQDAHELFHVLDTTQRGVIEAEDFVNGCLRLDGPAKAVDLAAFTEEHRRLSRYLLAQSDFMNKSLQSIARSVGVPVLTRATS